MLNSSQNEKPSRQELYRKSQHTFHIQKLLSENGSVYGTIWKKYGTARQGTDENVRRMCTACWINKAADTLIIFSTVCEIRQKLSVRSAGEKNWGY